MIEAYAFSEKGLVREENQDAVLVLTHGESGLFLVADGMGGHWRGELASSQVREAMRGWWIRWQEVLTSLPFTQAVSELEKLICKTNTEVYQMYQAMGKVGGTTLCALFVWKNHYAVFHLGDSRAYLWAGKDTVRLTSDDVDSRGRLTRALGAREQISPCVCTGEMKKRTAFLLCSDGVHKFCSDKELFRHLRRMSCFGNIEKQMGRIQKIVYRNGAGDNLSIVAVRVR